MPAIERRKRYDQTKSPNRSSIASAFAIQDGNNWPGPVRDFHAVTVHRDGTQYANFTWKPPYDSSIETLRGFEIHLAWQAYSALGNHCFFANLTNRNWTKVKDKYNVVFHFDCIQSPKALVINAYINSTPKPTQNITRRYISHRMNDIRDNAASSEVMVVPVYLQENKHIVSAVQTLRKLFHKVRMLSDESARMLCDEWMCQNSPYEILIILTESLVNIYEALRSGQDNVLNIDANNIKECTSALHLIETISGNGSNFKQPHFLSVFSEVDNAFFHRFSASDRLKKRSVYILSDIIVEGQANDIQCVLRKEDTSSLIQDIQGDEDRKNEISFNGTDITDIVDIQRHLLHYYSFTDRNMECHNGIPSCGMDKRKKDTGKMKVSMEPVVQFSHNRSGGQARIINSLSNGCHANPISPTQFKFHRNGNVHIENLQNGALDKRGLYGRNKFDRHRYQTEEEVPCMMGDSCFIPPSDSESLDNVSLCQEMLEINQRNLPAYSS
ncbi:hypothetical protein FSP39_001537 [Pinctada imbricata]|uniref:Uncharacterized protein n=1 Tax=Pinctada imbricata TaxID=66713 RepID=A0AA89BYB0_PINIB|nr:hypothetical protein FSP39_001537 [Pinctada imbricata]